MFKQIIFTSFNSNNPEFPSPTLNTPYKATKTNGMWHVLLDNDISIFVPENGKASWFTATITEVEVLPQEVYDEKLAEQLYDDVTTIITQDIYMEGSLASLLRHVASTYSDKYEEAQPMVDNTWLKYGPGKYPAGHNVGQAVNYLKRYLTEGFDKSYKVEDLKKAAHMILFELGRRENEV